MQIIVKYQNRACAIHSSIFISDLEFPTKEIAALFSIDVRHYIVATIAYVTSQWGGHYGTLSNKKTDRLGHQVLIIRMIQFASNSLWWTKLLCCSSRAAYIRQLDSFCMIKLRTLGDLAFDNEPLPFVVIQFGRLRQLSNASRDWRNVKFTS